MRYTKFKSPRRLCEGVEAALTAAGDTGRIVRRPFNHYVPALTDWWIVPSLELPFFKFGKYFFTWDEKRRDELRCGLYLAKGLDPMLAKVYPTRKGRRLLMDDTWAWHAFYPSVMRGELETTLRTCADALQAPLEIVFEGGYVDDPGLFNPDSELRKRDRYTLGYDPADGSLRVLPGTRRDAMSLKFLNKVHDWPGFRTAVKTLNDESFLWCDIFIAAAWGIRDGADAERDDESGVDAPAICRDWLIPLRPYVR